MSDSLFLDSNAGAPLSQKVMEGLQSFLSERLGQGLNPSGLYLSSKKLKVQLAELRENVSAELQADPYELIFTSSGTEALTSAFVSLIRGFENQEWHWIRSGIEHPAVYALDPFFHFPNSIQTIPTRASGEWDFEVLSKLLHKLTAEAPNAGVLLTLIAAQNESGVIQEYERLSGLIERFPNVRVILDAAQVWGKWPSFRLKEISRVDAVTFSGVKRGSLPGVGILAYSKKRRFFPLLSGTQERGRRGGTENTLGLLSLKYALAHIHFDFEGALRTREALEHKLRQHFGEQVHIWGESAERRLPQTVLFSLKGVESLRALDVLSQEGVEASAGSACSSGSLKPSYVILEMGGSEAQARSGIRFSWDRPLSEVELEKVSQALLKLKGLIG